MSHNLSRVSLSSESTSRYYKKVNVVVSDNERERKRERETTVVFFFGRWPHDSRRFGDAVFVLYI